MRKSIGVVRCSIEFLTPRSSFLIVVIGFENRFEIGSFELTGADEHEADGARPTIDEKRRRPRHVERVDADGVPHAVLLDDGAVLVTQNGKGQFRRAFLHALGDALASLTEDYRHPDVALRQLAIARSQLTELPSAVGSPHSAMENQQQPTTVRHEVGERARRARCGIAKLEFWSGVAKVQRRAGA